MTTMERRPVAELAHWNGLPEIFGWNSRLGHLLDDRWHSRADELVPGTELEETDDNFVLELELPGVTREDVTIDVIGRRVAVHGTRPERERAGVVRHSTRAVGAFACEFTLPAPVDDSAVTAVLADGVLRVLMPKASGARTTRVPIG